MGTMTMLTIMKVMKTTNIILIGRIMMEMIIIGSVKMGRNRLRSMIIDNMKILTTGRIKVEMMMMGSMILEMM